MTGGEFEAIARLAARLRAPPPGQIWIGDDAAVVPSPGGWLLLAADAVVEGVHADLALTGLDDLGWKALVANLSDVAAMGGTPGHALVTVAAPPHTDLDQLYAGLGQAADAYRCPVVGGDLVTSPVLVVAVAVTGSLDGPAITRAGARPGDGIWVTGTLGGAAAGLRLLRLLGPERATGPERPPDRATGPGAGAPPAPEVVAARVGDHARPQAPVAEGRAARRAGATAMIDVSDGFSADLWHLAEASGVGFSLDGALPVAAGASRDEALGGGEDYRLVFTAPAGAAVEVAFAGLAAPVRVGTCVADPGHRCLEGVPLPPRGWQHGGWPHGGWPHGGWQHGGWPPPGWSRHPRPAGDQGQHQQQAISQISLEQE
ncbi:MAG: thiamine-phosphate kinase [Acidimicrobiales bacterium]